MSHALLAGLDLHQPFHYTQEGDPGAVGAGLIWFKKSTKQLSYRNDANTAWISILSSVNSLALDPGSDWQDVVDAWDNIDPGDTVTLPNEMIVQEDVFQTNAKPGRITGGGPLSGLKLLEDVTLFGSSNQFFLQDVNGFELDHFTIEQDRATVERTLVLSIHTSVSNVSFHDLIFRDCTSDLLIIRPDASQITAGGPTFVPHDIILARCTCTEWYESYVNIREGSCSRVFVFNNYGEVSSGSPLAISRPYGMTLALEQSQGEMNDIFFVKNELYNTMANNANSLGLLMQWEGDLGVIPHRYNNIHYNSNLISGFQTGCRATIMNNGGATFPGGPCFAEISSNRFIFINGVNILVENCIGNLTDNLLVANNDIVLISPTAIQVIEDPAFCVTTTQLANRIS